jgi:hypothetical protein
MFLNLRITSHRGVVGAGGGERRMMLPPRATESKGDKLNILN